MPKTTNDAKTRRPKNTLTQKGADKKKCKLLNETCSLSNVDLPELNINHAHYICAYVVPIICVIIYISLCILIVEYGGHAI